MIDLLNKCLDDLENRIDADEEERLLRRWIDFCEGRFKGDIFMPKRKASSQPSFDWVRAAEEAFTKKETTGSVGWQMIPVNETLENYDFMALQQYGYVSEQLSDRVGDILSLRCNYGTIILPMLFGPEIFRMPAETNTLPLCRPLPNPDAVRKIVDRGVPDVTGGYCRRVLEMGQRFVDIGKQYPKIGKYVHIFHPDTQGTMDITELLWGSNIFSAVYETPDLVKDLQELVAETYIKFMHEWEKIVPFRPDHNCHWGMLHKGRIMLRSDSAMNFSPEMYDEFVRPYDQRLLEELGGGACHFCGRGDHYIENLCGLAGLYAVNMSQPQYNDVEKIYAHTIDNGISLLALSQDAAKEAVAGGRNLHGRVHCR